MPEPKKFVLTDNQVFNINIFDLLGTSDMVNVDLMEENPQVKLHKQLVSKVKTKLPIPDDYKIKHVDVSTKHIFILAKKSDKPVQKEAAMESKGSEPVLDLGDWGISDLMPPKTKIPDQAEGKTSAKKASEIKAAADTEKKTVKILEDQFNWDDP
jgi:hypothetical protein